MRWFKFSRAPESRVPERPSGQITTLDDRRLGVIDLGRAASSDVRSLIDRNILTHGEPFRTGGVLGTACLPVLGAGSAAASSLFAGNVFLATANPATLMTVGGGVTSAVVGAGGKIVAQAPFIAASTAIVPVVLPLVFFMVVSAMMVSARFSRVEASLDKLAKGIEELLRRDLAEDYGQALSAIERLQDISSEFEGSRRFTDEMKIRLALVERDLSDVHHKYRTLVDGWMPKKAEQPNDESVKMEMAPVNQHLLMLTAIGNLYTDRLRLRLALQDNPVDVARSVEALNRKVAGTREQFAKLLEDNPVEQYERRVKDVLAKFTWLERNVWKRGTRKALQKAERRALGIRANELNPVLRTMQSWSDKLAASDEGAQQTVVYYRDDGGKGKLRAYYTGDLKLVPIEQAS